MIMINYIYNKEARALDKMLNAFLKKRTLHIEEIETEPESKKRLEYLELKGELINLNTHQSIILQLKVNCLYALVDLRMSHSARGFNG